mmetsp:Transcript_35517/g.74569  ORF Transcript_35517/g.74569 Transcript_35517/m.74569 type:complete len:215 (-) Transcript_35517:125-769(-)
MATQTPSGMLCTAMATPSARPICGSDTVARKVARPSGKLCSAIASAVIAPMRVSFFFSAWLSMTSYDWVTRTISTSTGGVAVSVDPVVVTGGGAGTAWPSSSTGENLWWMAWTSHSSRTQMIIPPKKQTVVMPAAAASLVYFVWIASCALTKISMNETYNITPPEMARATASTVAFGTLESICGANTTSPPTPVARPAPRETRTAVITFVDPHE